MKKLKNQKGITLVALVITIIILLILAVVALREITGDGIIAKAKEARSSFETEQGRENTILSEYESELEGALSDGGSTPVTPDATEAVWGEVDFGSGDIVLYYIGDETNLVVTSDTIKVQEIFYNYDMDNLEEIWEKIEGNVKEANLADYTTIDMRGCPLGGNNLEVIDFGNKLSSNNRIMLYGAAKIEEVRGLEGLTTIEGSFGWCQNLINIVIPSTVTSIGSDDFENCSSLSTITIPNTMITIASDAFNDTNLTQVTINKTKAEVDAEGGIGTAWIPSSVTKIIYLDQTVDLTQNT